MAEDRKRWQNSEEIVNQIKVPIGSSAVDLGCGPGFFTIPLSRKLGKSGRIYAVDSDPVMLHHLTVNFGNRPEGEDRAAVVIMEADVCHSEIPDRSANLVFFANILHDVADAKSFFSEVKRILKANGQIVDIDWQKLETNGLGPLLERRLSETQSRNIIKDNGFKVLYALNSGPYHYGLVCFREEEEI